MAVRPVAELEFAAPATPVRDASWAGHDPPLRAPQAAGALGGLLLLVHGAHRGVRRSARDPRPIATQASATLVKPSEEHWLGTDHLGRDMYSRLVHGARVSLVVGLGSTLLGSVLGGIIGLLSGYAGGKTDLIAQRLLDILQGLPLLVPGPGDVGRAGPVDPRT
jgi:ABC-type dipeptide/oligopeptide/nickel transport system permease subunit